MALEKLPAISVKKKYKSKGFAAGVNREVIENGCQMLNKELNEVIEETKKLIAAPSCSQEAKDAANAWLDAVGTDNEEAETKKYIAELEEDIMPIDGLIGFAGSEAGAAVFGAEKAKEVEVHAKEVKAAGGKYCDCPACTACEVILSKLK